MSRLGARVWYHAARAIVRKSPLCELDLLVGAECVLWVLYIFHLIPEAAGITYFVQLWVG